MNNRMSRAALFELMTFVKEEYAKAGLSDAKFAEFAAEKLGYNVTKANVFGARSALGIESTRESRREEKAAKPADYATKADVSALLNEVHVLQMMIREVSDAIKVYFRGTRS